MQFWIFRLLGAVFLLHLCVAQGEGLSITTGACAQSIEALVENVEGHRVSLFRIKSQGPAKISALTSESASAASSVFLGVDEKGHFYLVVGDTRLDAVPLDAPMTETLEAGGEAQAGLVFRLKDVSSETYSQLKKNLESHLEENTVAISCVDGACRALKHAGIQVGDGHSRPLRMAPTVENILKSGFRDSSGKALGYDLYTVNTDKSISKILGELRDRDARLTRINARGFKGLSNDVMLKKFTKPIEKEDLPILFGFAKAAQSAAPMVIVVVGGLQFYSESDSKLQ